MHRLFFALWPDDVLRRGIEAVAEQQAGNAGGRAVRPDRYHMTLQFLGDFQALTAPLHASLVAAADAIQVPAPFELLLDHVGTFGAGRVLWLGCSVVPPQLAQLQRDLGEALTRAGVPPKAEAGFVPHVTLRRGARRAIEGPAPPLRWQVPAFVLVDSTAGDSTAGDSTAGDSTAGNYRMLGRWPLR